MSGQGLLPNATLERAAWEARLGPLVWRSLGDRESRPPCPARPQPCGAGHSEARVGSTGRVPSWGQASRLHLLTAPKLGDWELCGGGRVLSGLRGWQEGVVREPREHLCPLPGAHLPPTRSGRDSGPLEQGRLYGGSRDSQPPDTPTCPPGPASLVSRYCGGCREDGSPKHVHIQRRRGLWRCDNNSGVLGWAHWLPLPPRASAPSRLPPLARPCGADAQGGPSPPFPRRHGFRVLLHSWRPRPSFRDLPALLGFGF